ncbi:conserved hypothetical protein [Afipia carboxidovorans OM5]|uniref:Uncharacterized protein n=1 Tax=Afipia carboxidovorans (strain ATCC 49405 / DSM 1227 / KCTC 32145 / OM5) TaxID=504832 RepID=B6JHI5_AFIC5|nr:hypothetical protein [Afipia carboxidovorans]ACI93151.1 conserved hypothetical protein [Afipia carboxidovorans OM5]AEI03126.1 hypothetical protein OCA4_c19940 [Afipia carboxidovorans OM4]AEI06703.1 hypothetical protein OCA5_c19950 [Afipia carboxidovorans OM5]BEV43886.1 hypothetical protein CRBSH125_00690 [Afipia carboxidovorans]
MPYALFTNGEQISKAYSTPQEVWKEAEEAGLVIELPADEEKDEPKQVLDEDYRIEPCPPDQPAEGSAPTRKPVHQDDARPARLHRAHARSSRR